MFFKRLFRRLFRSKKKDELAEIRKELEEIRAELEEIKKSTDSGGYYTNEDGDKVPMAQVIHEYLYGKEDNQ